MHDAAVCCHLRRFSAISAQLERAGKLEAGTGGEGMSADDPLLLARVMEVREQIEDAKVGVLSVEMTSRNGFAATSSTQVAAAGAHRQ